MSRSPVVAVAGASGFIGSALCRELVADGMHVLALGRSAVSTQAGQLSAGTMASKPGITKRQADLFSLLQVERGIDEADMGMAPGLVGAFKLNILERLLRLEVNDF